MLPLKVHVSGATSGDNTTCTHSPKFEASKVKIELDKRSKQHTKAEEPGLVNFEEVGVSLVVPL